jgi:hypothetical protein
LADVLGTALGVGVGGAAVAAVSRAAHPVSGGVALAYAAAAAAAVLAVFLSPRLPRTRGAREAAPSP